MRSCGWAEWATHLDFSLEREPLRSWRWLKPNWPYPSVLFLSILPMLDGLASARASRSSLAVSGVFSDGAAVPCVRGSVLVVSSSVKETGMAARGAEADARLPEPSRGKLPFTADAPRRVRWFAVKRAAVWTV